MRLQGDDEKAKNEVFPMLASTNGSKIFIGSGARLYRLDAETGKLLQFYDIPSGVSGPPVIAYGKIYIGSDDGKLYCFGSPPAQPSSIIPQLVLGALAGAILLSVVLSLRFGPKRRR